MNNNDNMNYENSTKIKDESCPKKNLGRHTNEPVADTERKLPGSNVSIPDEESVIRAKEWVDKGSRL